MILTDDALYCQCQPLQWSFVVVSGVRLASTRMPVRCECFLSFSDDSFLAADLVRKFLH